MEEKMQRRYTENESNKINTDNFTSRSNKKK